MNRKIIEKLNEMKVLSCDNGSVVIINYEYIEDETPVILYCGFINSNTTLLDTGLQICSPVKYLLVIERGDSFSIRSFDTEEEMVKEKRRLIRMEKKK